MLCHVTQPSLLHDARRMAPSGWRAAKQPRPPAPWRRSASSSMITKTVCKSKADAAPENLLAQLSVTVLTEGLRVAGVGAKEYRQVSAAAPAVVRPLRRGDVAGVLRALRWDFEANQYFITGVLTDAIYDEDCSFEDPTVRFKGRELWKRNLQLLVPFLLEPAIKLKGLRRLPQQQRSQPVQLVGEWLLTCYVALPWRPYVSVNGSTTFTLNADSNQIVRHVEAWDISAWQALLLLLRPSERAVWKAGRRQDSR